MSETQQQEVVAPGSQHTSYLIGGANVLFPATPYPSQKAMMGQIMRGLRHGQNCLLESPTGSGKTLALLCSTLAWQREQTEKAQCYNDLIDQGVTDLDFLAKAAGLPLLPPTLNPANTPMPTPSTHASHAPPTSASTPQPVDSGAGFFYDDDADDFISQEPFLGQPQARPEMQDNWDDDEDLFIGLQDPPQRPRKLRVPKIFIGTRTHKQVAQLIKELRRTAYSSVRTVVLSSREHTCIHPAVSSSLNKNEACRELTDPFQGDGFGCSYYNGVHKVKTHEQLAGYGLKGALDIEDLVRLGKKVKACPYFTARSLLATAELVVCPYNYLVDPLIRESMDISLKNHVLVLDEAHNIEDYSREAASFTVTQELIREARDHLEQQERHKEKYQKLANMLSALSGWIDENNRNLPDYNDYNRSGKILTGTEMIAHLDHIGISRENYEELKRCFTSLEEVKSEETETRLHAVPKMVLKGLFMVFHYLYKDNMKYKDDYKVALIKEQVRRNPRPNPGKWLSKKPVLGIEYSINFWCFNPAVIFSPLSTETHSIILTSGTLSPMSSFQSELGVSFKVHLEASHVIDKSQIFVGTVGMGPQGNPLLATYQHTDSWAFQDELGYLILSVCETVPGGVLCFLPSYSMLVKLYERWQSTGVWEKISKVKEAMMEQKKGDAFEKDMSHFYVTIRNTQVEGSDNITGALFMAVYRGKVSEGMDFTDDNARAVITVGIPYPSIKDIQVDLKKKYNDSHFRSRKLLSGNEWYQIQAYRAVNQALGRCIRHRYDWGALILVDYRYQRDSLNTGNQENNYTKGLSKWVRRNIIHYKNFFTAINHLEKFVKNMSKNAPAPQERFDGTVLTTIQDSSQEKDIIKSPQGVLKRKRTSNTELHDSYGSPQAVGIKEKNCITNYLINSSQDANRPTSSMKKNPSWQEGFDATKFPSDTKVEKSESSFDPVSDDASKENNKACSKDRRLALGTLELDLDDFNLALSPSITPSAHHKSFRKRVSQKKGVHYIDLD